MCVEAIQRKTAYRISQTCAIRNLLRNLLGPGLLGIILETQVLEGSQHIFRPYCMLTLILTEITKRCRVPEEGWCGPSITTLECLEMSRITPISKPTKSPASQKKSFLLSNLFCGCWNQIAKSSPGQEETTSGLHDYTHRENLWPRQELSFTSGKPLSAAAEDQVRLTSVPQTPDTPPRCPSQQSLARFSQLIPAGPQFISSLLVPMNSLRSKHEACLLSIQQNTLNSQPERGAEARSKHSIVGKPEPSKTLSKYYQTSHHPLSVLQGPVKWETPPPTPSQIQESDGKSARSLLGGHSELIWAIFWLRAENWGASAITQRVSLQIKIWP